MQKHCFTMSHKQCQIEKRNKDQFLQSLVENLTSSLCQNEDENYLELLQESGILYTLKGPGKPSIAHGD